MKVQFKKGYQPQNVLEKQIWDLRQENQLLKDAALYHKNKFLEQKQQKQLYLDKWRKSEQQRMELLKQYKVLLNFIEEKNALQNHQYLEGQLSKSIINNSNVIIENKQQSINESNLNESKHYKVSSVNDLSKKQYNLQDNLIKSYLTKSKSKIPQGQLSNGEKSERNSHNNSTDSKNMKQQFSESKLMTLKQVTLIDQSTNKLNSVASAKKFYIPKMSSERRKSYFEKKKVGE